MKDLQIGTKTFFLTLFMLIAPRVTHATIISASFSNDINAETVGASTTTLITYHLNNDALVNNIQIDIYHLRDVSDTPGPSNQVASLPQTGVAGNADHNIRWDGLWPVAGNIGRQDGLYKIVIVDLTTSATFAISTFLNITSVDVHGVTFSPSFDANQNPALPYVITYALAKDSKVSVQVLNSTGTVVRTLALNAPQFGELVKPTNTLTWNGLDDNGRPVPLGIYTVTIDAKDPSSADTAFQRSGSATIQSLASLDTDAKTTFEHNAIVYPNPIRANNSATTCGSPACFQFLAVRSNATITLKVYTIAGDLVLDQTFSGLTTGNIVSFPWNATNQSGKALGRGLYYFVARENDAEGVLQTVKKMAVIR
jgi:flagellar hook assembly protein FlgD